MRPFGFAVVHAVRYELTLDLELVGSKLAGGGMQFFSKLSVIAVALLGFVRPSLAQPAPGTSPANPTQASPQLFFINPPDQGFQWILMFDARFCPDGGFQGDNLDSPTWSPGDVSWVYCGNVRIAYMGKSVYSTFVDGLNRGVVIDRGIKVSFNRPSYAINVVSLQDYARNWAAFRNRIPIATRTINLPPMVEQKLAAAAAAAWFRAPAMYAAVSLGVAKLEGTRISAIVGDYGFATRSERCTAVGANQRCTYEMQVTIATLGLGIPSPWIKRTDVFSRQQGNWRSATLDAYMARWAASINTGSSSSASADDDARAARIRECNAQIGRAMASGDMGEAAAMSIVPCS